MADEPKTDVSQNVTASGSPTGQQAPHTHSDSGYQQRIDGLTAERARLAQKLEEAARENAELREKTKTEHEKLLDAHTKEARAKWEQSELEPLKNRALKFEAHIRGEVDRLKEKLPAEMVPAVFDSWDVEVQHAYLSSLGATQFKPSPVGGVANPPQAPAPKMWTGTEVRKAQSFNQYDDKARAEYYSIKPELEAAYREGRIDWSK